MAEFEVIFDHPIDWEPCWYCMGDGEIVTCPDDLCQGAGECMHGDGVELCFECKGKGELPIYAYVNEGES